MKFHEKKDEMPPEVCKPSKKLKKNNVEKVDPQKVTKNNVEQVDPQKVGKKQSGKSGPPKLHKSSNINKFTKSPSSRGGIPIVRFLMHMTVIKNQKSALELGIRPS